jgi:hypothetical protein
MDSGDKMIFLTGLMGVLFIATLIYMGFRSETQKQESFRACLATKATPAECAVATGIR